MGVGGIGKTDILLSIRDIFNSDEVTQWLSNNIKKNIMDKDIPFISYVSVKQLLDREDIVLSNIITELRENIKRREARIKRFFKDFFHYISGIQINVGPVGGGISFRDNVGETDPWKILKRIVEKAGDTDILILLKDMDDISKYSYPCDEDRQRMQRFVYGLRDLFGLDSGKLIIIMTLDFVRPEMLDPLLKKKLFEHYELPPLEKKDINKLIKKEGIEVSQQALKQIVQISGGFPDCIKTICKTLKDRKILKVTNMIQANLLQGMGKNSWRDIYRQMDEHDEFHKVLILLYELNGSGQISEIVNEAKSKAFLDDSYEKLTDEKQTEALIDFMVKCKLIIKVDEKYQLRYVIKE